MIISNNTEAAMGQTTILVCVTPQYTSGVITWMRNGQTLTNSTLVTITEEDITQEDRAFTQSFVQICSVEMEDAGDYICIANVGQRSVNSSTQLIVSGKYFPSVIARDLLLSRC